MTVRVRLVLQTHADTFLLLHNGDLGFYQFALCPFSRAECLTHGLAVCLSDSLKAFLFVKARPLSLFPIHLIVRGRSVNFGSIILHVLSMNFFNGL